MDDSTCKLQADYVEEVSCTFAEVQSSRLEDKLVTEREFAILEAVKVSEIHWECQRGWVWMSSGEITRGPRSNSVEGETFSSLHSVSDPPRDYNGQKWPLQKASLGVELDRVYVGKRASPKIWPESHWTAPWDCCMGLPCLDSLTGTGRRSKFHISSQV